MNNIMLISDAAKEVNVENHVLRYWEEELHLPIKRNELGHRYYTQEDVERFKQIKSMKERGLQLKAIKMILKNGKLDVISQDEGAECSWEQVDDVLEQVRKEEQEREEEGKEEQEREEEGKAEQETQMRIDIIDSRDLKNEVAEENKDDKSRRLQWLLQQLIRETLQENNQQLCQDIKESVVKELDYQFRMQEEREEQREFKQIQRNEEYYKKMDELLRKKSRKLFRGDTVMEDGVSIEQDAKEGKKKRHSFF